MVSLTFIHQLRQLGICSKVEALLNKIFNFLIHPYNYVICLIFFSGHVQENDNEENLENLEQFYNLLK